MIRKTAPIKLTNRQSKCDLNKGNKNRHAKLDGKNAQDVRHLQRPSGSQKNAESGKIGCHIPNARDLCVSGMGHTEEQMSGNMCVHMHTHIFKHYMHIIHI